MACSRGVRGALLFLTNCGSSKCPPGVPLKARLFGDLRQVPSMWRRGGSSLHSAEAHSFVFTFWPLKPAVLRLRQIFPTGLETLGFLQIKERRRLRRSPPEIFLPIHRAQPCLRPTLKKWIARALPICARSANPGQPDRLPTFFSGTSSTLSSAYYQFSASFAALRTEARTSSSSTRPPAKANSTSF